MDFIYKLIEYHFKFEFKDYSGQYYGIPIIIQTIDKPDSDGYAYREAMREFSRHIQFVKNFIAPETLTIKMTKELKEIK